jgi:hypothetical protein
MRGWIIYERWVTQNDFKVCAVCSSLGGKVFVQGTGPQPPIHPNCRCRRVEVSRVLVIEPPPGPTGGPLPTFDDDKEKGKGNE